MSSEFVFEEGDPVHVGSPVENNFVYAEGDLVSDGDISDFSFIEDRGFGASSVLFYQNASSDWSNETMVSRLESEYGIQAEYLERAGGWSIDEALDEVQPAVFCIMHTGEDGVSGAVSQGEIDAVAERWDAGMNIMSGTEDTDASNITEAANPILEACVGTGPWDTLDSDAAIFGADNECTTNFPAGQHAIFDESSTIYRRRSEQAIIDNPAPFTAVWSDDDNSWAYYDEGTSRIWCDQYPRFDLDRIDGCSGNTTAADRAILWLLNQI